MCGFTGFWDFKKRYANDALTNIVTNMSNQMVFRGPDSSGSWVDEEQGLALGHRRLAVIDLSPTGHQPMLSHSGRMVLAYNGEIYNAHAIRQSLINEGVSFVGLSDTEVLLEACERWGIEQTLQQINGMFAFALWDKSAKRLFLARDRMGIKPLFYGFSAGILYFSSQLKTLIVHPDWHSAINLDALTSFFRFNYIPAPLSIYQGIQKLMPGSYAVIDGDGNCRQHVYWSLKSHCVPQKMEMSDAMLLDNFEQLLKDAVKDRMRADVPLGAFLSGGIDSSTVVALMQAQSDRPVKTFSIGFHEKAYNEANYAKAVAKHLGTDHHELYLSDQNAIDIIPQLPQWYDEPFADSSQIPTYLVSKLSRQHVTVSLSGDGGDELFAGYSRYLLGDQLYARMKRMPLLMRKPLAKLMRSLSPSAWNTLARCLPKTLCPTHLGDKVHKLSNLLEASPEAFYQSIVSIWNDPERLVLGGTESYSWLSADHCSSYVEKMQFTDASVYLPDDILTKVDRASMAVSLEARVPLLDHRVVEFAWGLPSRYKLRGKEGKWILRRLLEKHVPAELFSRPKMGFGVPIEHWLRGSLNDWAEDLLSEKKLNEAGILNTALVRTRWKEHLSGKRNWQYALWGVLMFQSWCEQYT